MCNVCKMPGKKEELLLLGTDWQAVLPLCCYRCQDEYTSFEGFSKEVQQRWRHRRLQKKQEEVLSRTATWKKIEAETEARYPGESRKSFRQRLVDAWYTSAALLAMAFTKATAEKKAKILMAFEEFGESIQKQADDETYVPDPDHRIRPYGQTGESVPDPDHRIRPYGQTGESGPSRGMSVLVPEHMSFFMPSNIGQWVDEICTGINEHFICRRTRCLCFCRSTDWIESSSKSHFKCPSCGAFYKPWSMKITGGDGADAGGPVSGAQKIMVMYTDVFLEKCAMRPSDIKYVLTQWADTKVETLKTRLKEIFSEVARETYELPLTNVISKMRQVMTDRNVGGNYMSLRQIPEWLKSRINHANQWSNEKFSYAHIEQGYMGSVASEDLDIMTQDDSTRMWIMAKYAVTAVARPRM